MGNAGAGRQTVVGEVPKGRARWVTQFSLNFVMSEELIRALTFVLCYHFSSFETNAHVGP